MKKYLILTLSIMIWNSSAFSQNQKISLWGKNVPEQRQTNEQEKNEITDSQRIGNVQNPEIEIIRPAQRNATGEAVLLFPGGGYHYVCYDWEGLDLAHYLNGKGITAIVVKYRLPDSKSLTNRSTAPLADAQRALRLVRFNAAKLNIDPHKIGIMGFSAGGHLASTLATQFDAKVYQPVDSADQVSARPDFAALIYPVISMKAGVTHQGSKDNLLGPNPSEALVLQYSGELNVSQQTPTCFLVHAADDGSVPVTNSLLFYQALLAHKIPAEMHLYPTGGHGFSLALGKGHLQTWPDRFVEWLHDLK